MKHLKYFESHYKFKIEDNYFVPKIGDYVYCINNNGVKQELELGQRYTVSEVWIDKTFRLKETDSRWMSWRFTTDPNHPIVLKVISNKFNI